MSISAIDRAWKYSRHGGSALLLLMALADWADDWGYCWPSHAAMARKIRSSERNVYYLLRKLEESGEIRVINRGRGGKGADTTVYQVIVGMSEEEIAVSEQRLAQLGIWVTPANFAPSANFSPEKAFSPLKELINRQLNAAVNDLVNEQQQLNDGSPANFAGENFAGEKSFTEKLRQSGWLPPEVKEQLEQLGWRGSLAEVEAAWQEDPERIRQWLWYAKKQGWKGALLRTVLRSSGEYPPELEPGSELSRRRYLEGPYADYIQH